MKKLSITSFIVCTIICQAYAQTNSFPSTGNAKIFAVDASWAEGLTIVKSSGWGGARFTRLDPVGGNYNGNWAIGYTASTANDFSFSTNYNGTQYDGVLHLSNSTRNVGIGTTAPVTTLQVMDPSWGGPPTATTPNQGLLISGNGTLGALNIGVDASGTFYSWIQSRNRSNNSVYNLALNPSGGNVGIGTTSPDYPLTVKGSIHAKEIRVDLTGPLSVPDYVFEKDYKLTSLEDIKTYIDQNKHLPEVPSAKEIEKNGVQLGEMNLILLKKIEELTLYMIEANKKIEGQQQQIEELKQAVKKN